MKLRKSPVKPVMPQNISSCLVLPPKIIMHDALMLFSEHPLMYASSCMTISGGRTEQLDIIAGFLLHHWLYNNNNIIIITAFMGDFHPSENVRQCIRRA